MDCISSATIVVEVPAAFEWWYIYTYLPGDPQFTLRLLQNIVSNHLSMTIATSSAFLITLQDLNDRFALCDYVISYDETESESWYANAHRYKI